MGGYISPPWGQSTYIIWNSPAWAICFFSHLSIELFAYIGKTHGYWFKLWVMIQYFFLSLFAEMDPVWDHWEWFQLAPGSFDIWVVFYFWAFLYFLVPGDAPGSSCPIFLRSSDFFLLENDIINQGLCFGFAAFLGGNFLWWIFCVFSQVHFDNLKF